MKMGTLKGELGRPLLGSLIWNSFWTFFVFYVFFLSTVYGNGEIESCAVVTGHSHGRTHIMQNSNQNQGQSGQNGAAGFGGGNGLSLSGSGTGNSVNMAAAVAAASQPVNSVGTDPLQHIPIIFCQIRTLHKDLDIENLTSTLPLPPESITRLRLVCNDVLFFESAIGPSQLSGLSDLHELWIEKCKLKHLPSESFVGLRHLRKLTINTGNSDWAARSLEISTGAFVNIPALRHLHLGFNHMWNIPERLLCQLNSLQTLNLTHNLLSEIDDLGLPRSLPAVPLVPGTGTEFPRAENTRILTPSSSSSSSSSCLGDLKSFDLSFNSLRSLGSRRLERMKRLVDFRVDHNWLEELEDDTFAGLSGLKLLNLSSNHLVALPPKLFQSCCKILRELDLRNNSLATLSPGLLAGLEHLQILDLSMNSLTSSWITSSPPTTSVFKGLVRLVILNLSNNQITQLTAPTFQDLYTLQILDLGQNSISSIEDGTFAPMSNLHSLNLGRNKIVSISANMLNGLYVLHNLILDYNELSTIESGALRNCTSLSDFGLVGNQLTAVPEALRGLQLLKTLDLGENRISTLSNESFLGMSQLYGIRLVDNQLTEIPKGLCDPISRLRVFNVAQNKINSVSSSAFVSCPELRVLRLDSNALDSIPAKLSPQLPNLLWLNISENKIRRADYSFLPATLEWFDVSFNQLESLGGALLLTTTKTSTSPASVQYQSRQDTNSNSNPNPKFTNVNVARLRVVDASHNQITQMDATSIPQNLETFRINHNQLSKIAPDTFSRSAHIRRVEMIGNQLESIPLNALRLPATPNNRHLPEFFMGGNPFLCDCEMEWLTQMTRLSTTRQYPIVLDLDAIVCRLAYSRSQTHVPLPEMKTPDFLCPYKAHCFNLCECCDFDACDCAMTCPANCTCYHDDNWTANVVNCAGSGHHSIPNSLPMDSTEVYLDGNLIPILKSHIFIGRKNLRTLYLNSSRIETISNKSFNGLQSLQSLHLEGNRLRVLGGYEFDGLKLLRELYLQDNLIGTISNSTFLPLKSLEILRIDGNRLVVFTIWQLSLNPYLVEIGLGRNEWNCDCQFLHQLYGWVSDNSKKIVDLGQVRCYWNTTHEPGPHLLDYNNTCGTSWALIQGGFEHFDLASALPLMAGILSAVLFVLITATTLFICRENARVWLFTHFGLRLCGGGGASGGGAGSADSDKSYDAYFIYGQKDEEFVSSRFADELETNDNYRLCLHYRDLISETGDLKEMMVNALDNSKSVIVFLSRNFLQGEWTSGEYRSAFHSVLKSSTKSAAGEIVKCVLFVHIEEVPETELSSDLKSWLSGSRKRRGHTRQLKWTDSKFWQKLKYSLPDPSCHYHSNITSHTTTSSASSGRGRDARGGNDSTMKYYQQTGNQTEESTGNNLTANPRAVWTHQNHNLNQSNPGSNFVALPPHYSHSLGGHVQATHSQGHVHGQNGLPPQSPLILSRTQQCHSPLQGTLPRQQQSSSPPLSNGTTTGTDSTVSTLDQDYSHDAIGGNGSHAIPSFLFQPNAKSPVPLGNFSRIGGGGDSYLSIEGEHVYSTLDPPSPQHAYPHPHRPQIQLPNGYTYSPPPRANQQLQGQQQWHPPHNSQQKQGKVMGGKKNKDGSSGSGIHGNACGNPGNSIVQTYLV